MTFHLHLTGIVQGVGFRPFVWGLARSMGLVGTVSNGADGVHIFLNADWETARLFRGRVLTEAPALAQIRAAVLAETETILFPDFQIIKSNGTGPAMVLLTPDFALCNTCRADMNDPDNRRFGYAFTTCTTCGPRYAISHALPYDRQTTTMAAFGMCTRCEAEYNDPTNRRFYAQTNSCPDCPVTLRLFDEAGQCVSDNQKTIVSQVVTLLKTGLTIAVKGIGGYLLLCDATNPEAIARLRARKHRPTKPLAVLYPSIEAVRQDCVVHNDERAMLTGPVSPIVLLESLPQPGSGLALSQLIPGLGQLGVMLPYAPLLDLIACGFGKPLVATSGNTSGSPICYTDEQALDRNAGTALFAVADYILTHNRVIVVPQDDSVVRFSSRYRQPIILRRSRGLAPVVHLAPFEGLGNVLAVGASLKSTFAGQWRGNTYVSQYLGDLESYDTQTNFRSTLDQVLQLVDIQPDMVLADQHEGYFSTQLARELAISWAVPLVQIQHHEAHFAAVLAENDLLAEADSVLGVIWDGTGYGSDGTIWGGEFMTAEPNSAGGIGFNRVAHLNYFPALLGDKMPREPRLSALSLAHDLPGAVALLRPKFTASEWSLYQKLLKTNTVNTSSAGRLFDAVAALLGLADRVSYEGEAAGLLEERASQYVRRNGFASAKNYLPARWPTPNVPTQAIMAGVLAEVLTGQSTDAIAAGFHRTLVEIVRAIARQTDRHRLAFSGGVFQNALLADWLRHDLGPTHDLYFHRQLSPNDECISFGQLARYSLQADSVSTLKTNQTHVLSHSR
jgi:hydrogenase maturation protein HypF